MIRYIYQHSNRAFAIRPSALYGLGRKEFLSQHVVPLNIFKGTLMIAFSHPFSSHDYTNKKGKLLLGVGMHCVHVIPHLLL